MTDRLPTSPSIPASSRRQLLTIGAGAAVLPFMPHIARAQATGRVIVSTWGGDYGDLLASNIERPLLVPKGIEVVQDTGTEPTRVAKIIAQRRLPRGTVDVVAAQAPGAYDMADAGLLEPLDEQKIPNLRYVVPELRTSYSIPHIFSPQVLIYSGERVTEAPKSFSDMVDSRYRGKVGILDNSFIWVMMAAALKKTGDASRIQDVKEDMERLIREGAHTYTATEAFAPAMKSGEIDIGLVWHARVLFWQKGGVAVRSAFPEEGSLLYVSDLAVLKNAPNKAAAFAYLNAALEPAAQRGFADSMGYMPTVTNAGLQGAVAERLALPEPRPKLIAADYAKLAAVRDEMNDWWRRLLDRR
jgi:putative spermidine/putrescine transport system substrate-binding protein